MKKLNKFSVHGTAVGSGQNIQLDEVSILADPQTIRELGVFLINASNEMSAHGLEHIHLQDIVEDFDYEANVDFIALNNSLVRSLPDAERASNDRAS